MTDRVPTWSQNATLPPRSGTLTFKLPGLFGQVATVTIPMILLALTRAQSCVETSSGGDVKQSAEKRMMGDSARDWSRLDSMMTISGLPNAALFHYTVAYPVRT